MLDKLGDKPIRLNEAEEPPKYKMFNPLGELLKMIDVKEPNTIYLVPRNNRLTEKLFEFFKCRL